MKFQIVDLEGAFSFSTADGSQDDHHVNREGPVFGVVEVQLHHLVEGEVAAAADLPEAGEAGGDVEALAVPVAVSGDFVGCGGAWADPTHFASQYVE